MISFFKKIFNRSSNVKILEEDINTLNYYRQILNAEEEIGSMSDEEYKGFTRGHEVVMMYKGKDGKVREILQCSVQEQGDNFRSYKSWYKV